MATSALDQLAMGSDEAAFFRVACEMLAALRLTNEHRASSLKRSAGAWGKSSDERRMRTLK